MCSPDDFHPYECNGRLRCVHCDLRDDPPAHDPRVCALCDPEYTCLTNLYWGKAPGEWYAMVSCSAVAAPSGGTARLCRRKVSVPLEHRGPAYCFAHRGRRGD